MKIAIDAGHGSNTTGKRTPDGYKEHYANVRVAFFFAKAMERCGIEYYKVGWNDENSRDDVDVTVSKRQALIKGAKCDYSISFHYNASGDGKSYNSASGIETYISSKAPRDSLRLANLVQNELIKGTPQKNRGVKKKALAMCNCSKMDTKASILVELGFMTNSKEAALMKKDEFCKECAEEAARGFCEYAGIKYVDEKTSNTLDIRVKVIVPSLNIRSGPGILNKKVGSITDEGIYTIVKTSGDWGYLKSGKGWININSKYVTRL